MGKPIVGVIGAIGAGKSSAVAALARRGGYPVDCDRLGHKVLDDPLVQKALRDRWGEVVFTPEGRVNRQAVAAIIFTQAKERQALEHIVLPRIAELGRAEIALAEAEAGCRFVILDAPTLLEAGWGSLCDRIIYIDAPRDLRLQRLQARSGWNAGELDRREAAQWPAEQKKARSHTVIMNDGSLDQLQSVLDQWLSDWNGGLQGPQKRADRPEEHI